MDICVTGSLCTEILLSTHKKAICIIPVQPLRNSDCIESEIFKWEHPDDCPSQSEAFSFLFLSFIHALVFSLLLILCLFSKY